MTKNELCKQYVDHLEKSLLAEEAELDRMFKDMQHTLEGIIKLRETLKEFRAG